MNSDRLALPLRCGWPSGATRSLLALLILLSAPAPAFHKAALTEKFRRWLNEEVIYLISDAERKAFLALNDDAEREQFIQEFWDARNPVRETDRNPTREEHYRRLQYATENFGRESNTPGWKTDMGRTYILLGKPISRTPFPGRGQTYPIELWFYRNPTANPSLPSFFYVLFYMPEEIGEYRFYRPFLDGPLKLVRGTQFRTNRDVYEFLKPLGGDLARAALSLIPGEPVDTQDFQPSISSDMVVSKLQNFANDPWEVERVRQARQLRADVKSWLLIADDRKLSLAATAVADSYGEYWLDFATLFDEETLGRPDGKGNLIVSSGYRLLGEQGELVFEDREEKAYAAYEDGKFQPFLLTRRIPVTQGRYRIQVEVANREAGRSWSAERPVVAGKTMLAEPLLALAAKTVARPDPAKPFEYFGAQFVPAVERVFTASDSLTVLFQVQQKAQSSQLEVEYILGHTQNRELRRMFADKISEDEFRNGRLLKAKTLPLRELASGDYRLVVNLRQKGSAEVISSTNVGFRVAETRAHPSLFVAGDPRIAAPEIARYLRELAAASQSTSPAH